MNRESYLLAVPLIIAIAAAIIDVRQHRIPNWLTYPAIVVGLAVNTVLFGWRGLVSAFAGCVLAGGIMFLFYVVRAMGAGDVKLMAALGAWVGPHQAVGVLLATAICGGLLAIAYAIYRRQIGSTLKNVGTVLRFHASSGLQTHPDLNLDNPAALRMPYGLAIALGMLYTSVMMWWR